MNQKFLVTLLLALAIAPVFAQDAPGLHDTTILIIRHAEKPATGFTLTPEGEQRAQAYTNYFRNFTLDSQPLKLNYLIAAANSENSHRPFLTLEPLSKAIPIDIDNRFPAKDFKRLADELRSHPHGKQILICWHHGDIPQLAQALGADPAKLLPNGRWPDDVFCWVLQLRYDATGQLSDARRINEDLMPGDSAHDK